MGSCMQFSPGSKGIICVLSAAWKLQPWSFPEQASTAPWRFLLVEGMVHAFYGPEGQAGVWWRGRDPAQRNNDTATETLNLPGGRERFGGVS